LFRSLQLRLFELNLINFDINTNYDDDVQIHDDSLRDYLLYLIITQMRDKFVAVLIDKICQKKQQV